MNISIKDISGGAGVLVVRGRLKNEDESIQRRRALRRVDRELEKGNSKAALTLVKQFRGFGAAKLVPRRMEIELNGTYNMGIRTLVDSILQSLECCLQFALEEKEDAQRLLDSLADNKAGPLLGQESLLSGDCYNSLSDDRLMCLQHEAGHFLVGYLLGVLPKRYKVPTMEDLVKDNFAGGNVEFLGFEFLREVNSQTITYIDFVKAQGNYKENKHMISSKTLNRFLCVILGGLVAEHLVFGYTELLHSDVEKLERVLRWSGLKENEAKSRIKWAAITTVLILRQQNEARSRLADAMSVGKSIGCCIDAIENALNNS